MGPLRDQASAVSTSMAFVHMSAIPWQRQRRMSAEKLIKLSEYLRGPGPRPRPHCRTRAICPSRYQASVVNISEAYVHMPATSSQNWEWLSIEKLPLGLCADASDLLAEPKVSGH